MEDNEVVQLLLQQNQLTYKLGDEANRSRGMSKKTTREHRMVTSWVLQQLLGREPSTNELDTVCNA